MNPCLSSSAALRRLATAFSPARTCSTQILSRCCNYSTASTSSSSSSSSPDQPKKKRPQSQAVEGKTLKGLSYLEGRSDPIAQKDEEYPEWLWELLDVKDDGKTSGGGSNMVRAGNPRTSSPILNERWEEINKQRKADIKARNFLKAKKK